MLVTLLNSDQQLLSETGYSDKFGFAHAQRIRTNCWEFRTIHAQENPFVKLVLEQTLPSDNEDQIF